MKRSGLLAMVLALVLGILPAVPVSAAPGETVMVDSYSSTTVIPYFTLNSLTLGQKYTIIIKGTFSLWESVRWAEGYEGITQATPMFPSPGTVNGPVGVDIEHAFAIPTYFYPSWGNPELPTGIDVLRISLDNGASWIDLTPVDGTYSRSHTYQYNVTGLGLPLGIKVQDVYTSDNYGVFKCQVEAVKQKKKS